MAPKKAPEKKAAKPAAAPAAPQPVPTPTKAAPAPPTASYRVVALQTENIKRLSFVRVRPKGNTVIVSGENGSGKTSLLDSIAWALTGERQLPSQPIRKGQQTGKIQVDLGDLKVERTFTRINGGKEPFLTRLAVYGKNREQYPTPQSVLDKLRSVISFDPLAFVGMDAAKQLDTLRKLITFDVDLDQLEAEKKEAYGVRRDTGRDIDGAKARLKAFPTPEPDLPTKPIPTGPFTKELQDAANAGSIRNGLIQKRNALETERDRHATRSAELKAEAEELVRRAEELSKRAAQETEHFAEREREIAATVIPDEIDTKATLAALNAANATNLKIQSAAAYRNLEKEIVSLEAAWTELDNTVKAKEKERADAIERAKMPIEKLSIGEGEVLYDTIPYSQISNAEQIRVAVALAMASNPQLRLLLIRDGSLLDSKSLALIEKMAQENDFQVWIERVEKTGKIGIVMEDGEASGDEVEQR